MTKKILITGASGLLGRDCLKVFSQDPEWTSLGLAFSRKGEHLKRVDLTDSEQVAAVVKEFQPTVILHAAAERRPDVVELEEDKTKKINVDATRRLCDLANATGAYVLFISTDYVFDGSNAPYKPTDKPNPLNKYGLSKAEGEKVVLESNPGNVVLRVPVLYGAVETLDESAVTVLFSKVKDPSRPAEMNHYERRYPTFCPDVAEAIKVLVESKAKNSELSGIFHWSGTQMMTKYDMALAMAELYGIPTNHIVADTKPASGTPRPFDCHLDCSRMEALGISKRTPFKVGIKEALEKFYP
ncbi:methionine adenosyltransferase 2 subunit beta-like [Physella acuta]|uniref:methionine adenosyltransferase 2 subunit beta-like n=1 Tax=Physella acuta TaxID=109671 RepID=UPI0027DC196C|nr:methionine adenosyltransferase 2 subunit beta-like [Physella acuta]XP_059153129.1 methionine adenosyltransferase 2 subunit beta-like [Physella acuta]XP_059153130.1 methionine adenosyltransferase 2 subunit beta-like [Physella acuta]